MRIAVLGAGAGGAAAVAELMQAGHEVTLWNRSAETLAAFQSRGGIEYEGVLGDGLVCPRLMTANLPEAVAGCDAVVVTLPTFSHAAVADALARSPLPGNVPVLLNPGHTGGVLEFAAVFRRVRRVNPLAVEFSTLTYVARKYQAQRVTVTGRAKAVRVSGLPGAEPAIEMARGLFPCARPVADIVNTSLSNVNMVLHPPGAILGAAWVEAKSGDFKFYVEGMTPGVARVMKALDEERRAVARAFGHDLPDLISEMKRIGTVEAHVTDTQDFAAAISGGEANSRIKAPGSLAHRYYREDFGHGLLPFMVFAAIGGVAVPVAESLFRLCSALTGTDFHATGRTAETMGISGLDRAAFLRLIRG